MSDDSGHAPARGALAKIEDILEGTDGGADGTVTLGALSDSMGERAFGLLMLVLALPCCVPFIYLLPQLVALPMLVLAFQMARGRHSPWLPEGLRRRRLPIAGLFEVLAKAKKYGGWLERLAHPRLGAMTGPAGIRLIGALLLIPCASILVPLPLTNTVPGAAVAAVSVGLIERDGLFVALGLVAGLIWVAILVIGGPALMYFLIDWALNRTGTA